jgi:biopolymer transport protein TolR
MAMGLSPQRRGRHTPPMSEINVTPLVDVMLVLLIIFMVTAPLLVSGVPVDLPDSKAGALKADNTPIQLSIDRSGQIFIDDQAIGAGNLADKLAAIRDARLPGVRGEEPRIYIRGDAGLDYGLVMRVVGAVDAAGFKRVALVSEAAAKGDDR